MHCSGLVVDLEKHLPAGQFTSLDDKLKTKGSWLNSWSEDQNLVVSLDDKLKTKGTGVNGWSVHDDATVTAETR